ncbi:MAG: alpha-glucan phosphorylase [Bacteroidetes bacterium GWE2_29_8]|nr:MAG: alpha-glucan phosphorylase [Bacteroidetes bacterium GWE2_29_8]OFY15136.1 MAG: alpha-glucan phosphorylase [Bacteroidetes bacterium GWF2_29_10]
MDNIKNKPDYIFEVSWEVCNKVGGIYTVVSTKALTLIDLGYKDRLIMIGPDIWKDTDENPDFVEDKYLFKSWREYAQSMGLKFRIGHWNIAGYPIAIMVDFTQFFSQKDEIFADLWVKYKLDSLSGQWDYTEPALFGYAAGKIIESFYLYNLSLQDHIVAQFHEWMTGAGGLYLNHYLPQVATVFTTHATVLGRCIAGNGLQLYKDMSKFNVNDLIHRFQVESKFSLELTSAKYCDAFTTVSEITNEECKHFFNKSVDVVTPNGFENSFVPKEDEFVEKREFARAKLKKVAQILLNKEINDNAVFVSTSGRYEYRNKGIDVFIDSLAKINDASELDKEIIAFILVPANHSGPNKKLQDRILDATNKDVDFSNEVLTHGLHDADYDPILRRLKDVNLNNGLDSKVNVIFVPCYLNGNDGIFNIEYYDLLIGFDLTVYCSYYEPWGYTPLESIAFKIPTITTTFAGFGMWVKSNYYDSQKAVYVLERSEEDNEYNIKITSEAIMDFVKLDNAKEINKNREKAWLISQKGLWKNIIENYFIAYSIALDRAKERKSLFVDKFIQEGHDFQKKSDVNKPIWKKVLVKSTVTSKLESLTKLSKNVWCTWNHDARKLFKMINPDLWDACDRNPISMLNRISYGELLELENNKEFLELLQKVSDKFDNYVEARRVKKGAKIAYFSMEYGLHTSIKIYSGGLGILAGDYLKEASDSNVDIVAIGLLYRNGYFTQTMSNTGEQIAEYIPQRFSHIPLIPVRDEKGDWMKISLVLPGRILYAKIWKIEVGVVPLYLLDTDIDENTEEDKVITSQLYGGDWENRFKQELLLGVGGIRLIEALNIKPDLYHCNEGHAAFIGIERLRKYVQFEKLSIHEALEIVRATTLFTTHTPVPAGHDAFSEDVLRRYIPHYASRLNITWEQFMGYGRSNENSHEEKFSMSVLAAKLSQEINGVSRIHGNVTKKMFNNLWEGFFAEELENISYVTNGVHLPTWTSTRMLRLYKSIVGDNFEFEQDKIANWEKIYNVDDKIIWDIKQEQKEILFTALKERVRCAYTKRNENPKYLIDIFDRIDPKALTIGFARRFATYKRAHLLFSNLEKLDKLVNNEKHPVQFVFAGKAHPQDKAGQDLIKRIIEISKMPQFYGRILFVENYDMELGAKLVQGVDVWLNTPTRPLEASGTSGEKAVMNGVLNLSVLDGWWAEGYEEGAGWALQEENTYNKPELQDQLDAEIIYDTIKDEIVPLYYNRNNENIPVDWIKAVKKCIAGIAPRFTMNRMINDYKRKYYERMYVRSKELLANDYALTKEISNWKKKVLRGWGSIEIVEVSVPDTSNKALIIGDVFDVKVVLDLNELSDAEIGVEIVITQMKSDGRRIIDVVYELTSIEKNNRIITYKKDILVKNSGVYEFGFRIFPKHEKLPHRQDFPVIKWI